MQSVYDPNFLSVTGLEGGTIEFSSWLKESGSNEPITTSWVSFTFESDVGCVGRFGADVERRMALPQVGVIKHLQHAPKCHDLWEPLTAKTALQGRLSWQNTWAFSAGLVVHLGRSFTSNRSATGPPIFGLCHVQTPGICSLD